VASDTNDRCVDSLRLSEKEQQSLIEKLDRQGKGHRGAELRTEDRLPYHTASGVVATLHHPGGSVVNYLVRPRNLSRRGVGFLHGNFVHIGSRCQIHLLRLDKRAQAINGTVARCQHVGGLVHEIGVRFDEPIELSQFLVCEGPGRIAEGDEHSLELPKLAGKVLYVDNSVDDQELLRFHLGNLGVEIFVATDALQAMDILRRQQCDMVVTEIWLPGMTGAEFAEMLRSDGYAGPIIALTSDDSGKTREEALSRGCNEVRAKPFTLELLIQWFTPHLSPPDEVPEEDDCLRSSEWDQAQMRPLILSFLGRMESQVHQLTELLGSEGNLLLIQKLSRELKGSAGGYGYPLVSRVAADLCELSAQSEPPADAMEAKCRQLEELCRRACLVRREVEGQP
jgi:CheY-like chemotaxis protein